MEHGLQKLPIEIDYSELLPLLNKATFALGTLSGLFRIIPNPCLLISPLTTREATLSSKIEGTLSTLTDVYEYEAGVKTEHIDIAEVINYRTSLEYAIGELKEKDFDLELLKKMHEILMKDVRGGDRNPGEFRKIQNWIGKFGAPVGKARYVPPPPEIVDELLENLREYMVHDEKDPLVQAGLIHSQFESIHPFLDGNGRIGRLLIPLFLYRKKLLPYPILYVSEYLEENRDEYYDALWRVTRDKDYITWLKFFLTAVKEQCDRTQKTIYDIMALYEDTKKTASEIKSPYALAFVDLIFRRPIFSGKVVETNLNTNRTTVMRLVQAFTKMGIIREMAEKKRNRLYRFDRLFDILNGTV
ncbi:MAG: Fic family protein [Candidatus Aenigmatarchaeota archaeon]